MTTALVNAKRKLTGMGTAASSTRTLQFDALGRVLTSEQVNAGETARTFAYTYRRSGFLSSITYPSGRTVNYTPTAAERVASVSGSYQAVNTTYVASAVYAPHGGPQQPMSGPGLVQNWRYNGRLQMDQVEVMKNSAPMLRLTLDYGLGQNNGNVLGQQIHTGAKTFAQSYVYDLGNRLQRFVETENGTTTKSQDYGFDAFGNLWQQGAASGGRACCRRGAVGIRRITMQVR